ncbi:hypothetical protein ABH899_003625 [Paenibacillus sp. RC84]
MKGDVFIDFKDKVRRICEKGQLMKRVKQYIIFIK